MPAPSPDPPVWVPVLPVIALRLISTFDPGSIRFPTTYRPIAPPPIVIPESATSAVPVARTTIPLPGPAIRVTRAPAPLIVKFVEIVSSELVLYVSAGSVIVSAPISAFAWTIAARNVQLPEGAAQMPSDVLASVASSFELTTNVAAHACGTRDSDATTATNQSISAFISPGN